MKIHMKRVLVLTLACWIFMATFQTHAQEKDDISLFGGYSSYLFEKDGNRGWNASLAGNLAKHLAFVVDASGHRKPASDFNLLFGPRYIHMIRNRVTPFTHILIGLEHESRRAHFSGLFSPISYRPNNAFACSLGFGADIRVRNWFSVRAFQLDVLVFKANGFPINLDGYLRASFGAVFRLNKAAKS
jgi:hypothetical protein